MDIGSKFENQRSLPSEEETSLYDEEEFEKPQTTSIVQKGDYIAVKGLVVQHDEESNSDQEEETIECFQDNGPMEQQEQQSNCYSWCFRTIVPDAQLNLGGSTLVDLSGVKFFKFLAWTFVGIVVIHFLVKWLGWERDEDYSIQNMILFDANLVVLDVMVFFVVGRMFRQGGMDYLAWLATATVSSVFSSWAKRFTFLQHSLSLYEISCGWPLELWLFIAFITPLVVIVVWKHVWYAALQRNGLLKQKVFEFIVSFVIFVIPYASHPNFHMHHWYAFWLLGMHANYNTWWSRLTMAWCWGQYVNGIAVYGRDPILTCATSFYYSTNARCPFMECSLLEQDDDSLLAHHDYKPMEEPDWRNCTGYIP